MSVRFLRRPAVEARTGLSRSRIDVMMERGTFPRPRRVGERAVGWEEAVIEDWIASRVEANPQDARATRRRVPRAGRLRKRRILG